MARIGVECGGNPSVMTISNKNTQNKRLHCRRRVFPGSSLSLSQGIMIGWCSVFHPCKAFCIASATRLFLVALLTCATLGQASAAGVPVGFVDTQVASGLNSPTALTVLPDGRVLVVQQNGVIKMIKDDAMLPANFHAVQNVDSFAERGCLGITSDPDFAANHLVYIYCTVKDGENSFNRILRVREAGDRAIAGSEQTIHALPPVPPGTKWHMGGALRFGLDGKLYVAVGGHEDTRLSVAGSNSQDLSNPFGKILRINADGSVPGDNPYAATSDAYPANFALGLRNPFALDIQPDTGRMYINDVGAGSWEEINQGVARANYGWPASEGASSDSRYTNAVHAYSHSEGCAITGGVFYNPPATRSSATLFPAQYLGKYFFADFCKGDIRFIDPANPAKAGPFATDIGNPVNLAVAPDGSLYYLARNQDAGVSATAGTAGKISFTNTQAPRITAQPRSQTIFLGDPVTFTMRADGASAIQWQRNGVDIPGATAAGYTIARTTQADHRVSFTAVARNAFGSVTSTPALLTVSTNRFPQATITRPAADSGFAPDETVRYAGTGTDAEDGTLPPAALTWQVDFMHDTHSHPFMAATSGAASGSFAAPDFEADAANTWFRLSLTVTDSLGQTHVATRDIYPRTPLADMTPVGVPLNGLGPIEKNKSNGGVAAGDGAPITLDRIAYAKGLGVHAPSELRYRLDDACSGNLVADVGVDDGAGDEGSVVFQVWLDGAKAFDSGVMRGSDRRKPVNVSVAGKNELRLVVTDSGDGNASDFADWAGARVTGCPALASVVVAEPAADSSSAAAAGPALAQPAGGGCSTVRDSGRFDATLTAMLLAALVAIGWRRRRRRI